MAKALEKHVRSSSFSIGLFEEKLTFIWKIYWTAIFITISLHQILQTSIFQNSYFWLVIEKSIVINEN